MARGLGAALGGASSRAVGSQEDMAQGTFGQGSGKTPEVSSARPTVSQGRSWREETSLAFLTRALSCPARCSPASSLLTQARFGNGGSDCPSKFCLFQSETKNLLFNDNTECLAKLHGKTTYDKYLGQEYVTAVTHLRRCSISRK